MQLVESFSGIRGIFDKTLTEDVAVKYAISYFNFLKNKLKKKQLRIVIGTDTRPSRNELRNTVIEVLNCEIIDIGVASTPAVELAVRHYKADGGIIITASHNEPYWNGFKFLDKDGAVLRQKDMEKVIKTYHEKKDLENIGTKKIIKKYKEINELYEEYVLSFLSRKDIESIRNSNLKIVIDPNGGTGIIAKKILEKLNVKVDGINMDYGIFNRVIEPNFNSLYYLKNIINEKKAAFAAAFDCDADRMEIALPSGRLVSGHYLLALIIDEILSTSKNKIVVTNDATSNIVNEVVKKNNGKIKEVEVGEINVVDEMQKNKSLVGGEGSSAGVIIKPSKCRDGIVTLLYILKIIAKKQKTLQKILKEYPEYYTLATKVKFNPKNQEKIKKYLKNYYLKKGYKATGKGSIKVFIGKNSFVWFRASKTESNIFRVIADSTTTQEAQIILNIGEKLLKQRNFTNL